MSAIPADRIKLSIKAENDLGKTAFIPFITAGYPDKSAFLTTLNKLATEAAVIEIGVPFSDPMADGVTIQRSSQAAINSGVNLQWIISQLKKAPDIEVPIVLMSYLNPLIAYGFEELAKDALAAQVCGFIVPDLPFEESEEFRTALDKHGIGLIQLVTPATPDNRLEVLCKASQGFVYAVTITGITGSTNFLPQQVADYLNKVRGITALPVCAGFGVRKSEQVKMLSKHANGLIIGSALVEALEKNDDPAVFLKKLRA
ncbi:MAG: tryptophan synthase subunit alpha [Pseudomonadota bacterium]|nr:tryptophan synthase subunit alpha [Pseudomonadota bacterium]